MKKLLIVIALFSGITATGQDTNKRKCAAYFNNGKPCTHYALGNGTCKMHDPSTPKCGAKKADGKPCKIAVNQKGQLCHIHSK